MTQEFDLHFYAFQYRNAHSIDASQAFKELENYVSKQTIKAGEHWRDEWSDVCNEEQALINERDALKAKNTALLEALNQVMSWIDNWSPEFSYDPEWPKDRDSARAAIAKALGEKI